jgi:hypothetical protein
MAFAVCDAAEIHGASTLGWGETAMARAAVMASSGRRQDIYQRHAAALYRQALLTLGDSALAEHVVCDVIVEECALAPVPGRGEDDARNRLAESIFRRCHQLTAVPAQRDRRSAQLPSWDVADRMDPDRLLSEYERGALGLVLFGGFGYVGASRVLGIDPRDMAVLMRAVLLRLTTPSAAVEDAEQV